MSNLGANRRRFLEWLAAAPVLAAARAWAGNPLSLEGWQVEKNVDPPSYAVIEPRQSNLNIDTVVLACSESGRRRILQFEVYLKSAGPLLPAGAAAQGLRHDPRGEVVIDGQVFPVTLSFAEDFVVVADSVDGRVPVLSKRLLDTLERGRTMTLRFALLTGDKGFDGQASIDLRAGAGGSAVAAVRRCVRKGAYSVSSL